MAPQDQQHHWTIVIPVRNPHTGKSRLGTNPTINSAIAHDTIHAALNCPHIAHIIIVTDQPGWINQQHATTTQLSLLQQHTPGLNAAITEGLTHTLHGPTAIMLGDLPSLTPPDLTQALNEATLIPLGMVTDHHGTGTTLITAQHPMSHQPRFGTSSAAKHKLCGYQELPLPTNSKLRYDVDTPEDLKQALRNGTGPATTTAFEKLGAYAQ